MDRPRCPECGEQLFVQERSYSLVNCTLESGDPSMPCPGGLENDWYDEDYHPHYHCAKCNQPYSFSMEKLHPLIAGEHNQEHWANDSIQFPRLIEEILSVCEDPNLTDNLCRSMDLELDDLLELFARARKKWEKYKEAIASVPRTIEFETDTETFKVVVSDPKVDVNTIEIFTASEGKARRKRG